MYYIDSDNESDFESSGSEDEREYEQALKDWEANVEKLRLVVSMVLFPYLGRWAGRKWAHWSTTLCMAISHQLLTAF